MPPSSADDQVRDPVLRLENVQLAVEAGGRVRTSATVYNPSDVVENYSLEVLGAAAPFGQVVPERIPLMPGGEATAELEFAPPPSATTPAGTVPFGLRCISDVDDYHATVAEGTLEIGAVEALFAQVVAVTSRGRWVGRYRIEVKNEGTGRVDVDLSPQGRTEELGFALVPTELSLAPGEAGDAFLKVRPRSPFLLGGVRRHDFQVVWCRRGDSLVSPNAARGVVDAVFEQRAVASKALVVGGIAGVAGLAVAAALLPRRDEAPPTATIAPERPPTPVIEVVDSTSLLVSWEPDPTATQYSVLQLTDATPDADVIDVKEATGAQTALQFDDLESASTYCFAVQAWNDEGKSESSQGTCQDTPAAPADTETDTGQKPAAEGTGSGDGEGGEQTEEGGGAEGESTGGGSEGSSETESGITDGGSGEDSFEHDFIVIYHIRVTDDDVFPQESLGPEVAELVQAGVDVETAYTDNTQRFGEPDRPFWAVFEDGFDTFEEAAARCAEFRELAETCQPVDPSQYFEESE